MKRRLTVLTLAALYACTPAFAQEHRHAGKHEHGRGTLNIAIEGTAVNLALEVPGTDIVGFEHEAKTAADKAAVGAASKTLSQPLDWLKLPADAGCVTKSNTVAFEADDAAGAKGHKEFHVNAALECAAPAKLTAIEFPYFAAFKRAQSLTVNAISAKGQSSFEVSRKKPRIDLGKLQ
jgi:hypothetical protein